MTASAMRVAASVHVGQRGRVRQQVADRRIEEALGLVGGDAAPGQHARDDVGHAMALRDGKRRHVLPLGQAGVPRQQPVADCLTSRKRRFVGRHGTRRLQIVMSDDMRRLDSCKVSKLFQILVTRLDLAHGA